MSILSSSELKALIDHQSGWCVSIYMPTYRAGAEIQQNPIRFKNLIRESEARLRAKGLRTVDARAFLEPARRLLRDSSFWRHQSDGLAAFLSQETFRTYHVPFVFKELLVVGERFHVKPLMPLLSGDGQFYLLALSQNEVRLLQGTRYSVSAVELTGIPTSLAEALKFDDAEKQLQFRTSARAVGGAGGEQIAFHGHGVGDEGRKKDILRFFHQVDAGVRALLQDERSPLVLAGVDYLLPLYRETNEYPHLVDEGIEGNPEELSAEALHRRAWAVVQPRFLQAQEEAAAEYRRLAGSDRASDQIGEIVPAAHHGQIKTLFVTVDRQQWGAFDPAANVVRLHNAPEPGDEDLLDLAAVQTIVNGGVVYAVEQSQMPDGALLAAVFRY